MIATQTSAGEFEWGRDLDIPDEFLLAAQRAHERTAAVREAVRRRAQRNHCRVIKAFREVGWGDGHFFGTTGYGFHDTGREALDRTVAMLFGAEAATVRWNFVSGTHAIAALLFGALRPGDRLLSVTGEPYDTLKPVLYGERGSLAEWGVGFDWVDGLEAACKAVAEPAVKMVFLQRSRGYDWKPSLSLDTIEMMVSALKKVRPDVAVLVDNCYGEMVEEREPTHVGADCLAGSLIKNLGGTLAPTGGYLTGRRDLVEAATIAATAPGICGEEGATLGMTRTLAQGVFFSPLVVGEALEGAVWASALLESLGLETSPRWDEPRTDTIQAVRLGDAQRLQTFCRGIQSAGPIDARAVPRPVMNPGYRDPIVMAGGTFIQGSSSELSADGPLRPPFAAYLQGGTSCVHVQMGVLLALRELRSEGLL
jgi:cystathionine beta-lyase family protein involved in aluminum resistance